MGGQEVNAAARGGDPWHRGEEGASPRVREVREQPPPAIFLCGAAARMESRMSESGKAAQKAIRQRRLSAALRENLRRRKAQARGRDAAAGAAGPSAAPHDSAGIGAEKPDGLHAPSRPAQED